ncbi:AAA family ATPase [Billgrantia saliphila]|uniref:AAA family ATPase n=1 Tax=Billgrantia saliphila TaxID=1848458 RepID=UPI000CE3DB29|nr:AAA family ATPase [Halomonas saliphila]
MSQYLLSFARSHLDGKSDAYLALFWCLYKANQSKGRYSEHIKTYLATAADELLQKDYQRIALRFKKVLDAKPELDWVAPSGLSPLAYLQVKNFRGFGELSSEDKGSHLRFSKTKNIFYAPNGGGKSSLCEALEYGTTGHIKEADRRKTKVRQYIARGAAKMSLSLVGTDRAPVTRSIAWASCFIDRNRLHEFSLLGSKDTGSHESDVIATLFGLEEFQDVISRFVKPESFSLNMYLRQDHTEALATIDSEKAALIKERRRLAENIIDLNNKVCAHLVLPTNQQGAVRVRFLRLAKLAELKIRKAERLKLSEPPTIIKMERIRRAGWIATRLLSRKSKIEAAFLHNVSAVNYRAVYEALVAIESTGTGDVCPACSTSLRSVTENPFEKARRELQSLSMLEQLQISQQRNDQRIAQLAAKISTGLAEIETNTRLGVSCSLSLSDLQSAISNFQEATDRAMAAAQVLAHFTQLLTVDSAGIEAYFNDCQQKNVEIQQADVIVNGLEEQASTLKKTEEVVRELFTEKIASQRAYTSAGERISSLLLQTDALQNEDAGNARFNSFIQQLQLEYGNLYRDLLGYKLSLENSRIAGIEKKAADYYKAINDHDDEHERIESIRFDKASDGYRIKISNADGTSIDAFSILSEGHLRTLGLSLLLAMAEKNNFPLIVFDDVVNAIDSDHRSNIIDLFFSDPYLKRTQMVVTTHDRLFWERFCIIAERHPQADQHSSCVLSYTNKGVVIVDYAGGFQAKVHEALTVYDVRQALIYCRIWFESMVVEYCLENSVSITAKFGKSNLKKNIYLQISLEKTFALVEPHIAYDLKHFNLIKNDLVNWSGQNQEHHAFDEASLNFVHSKTSQEVIKIYDALRLLECQLFPSKKQASCQDLLQDVNEKIDMWAVKIERLGRAPAEVQLAAKKKLDLLRKRADELTQELAYVEVCLAGMSA